MSIDSSLSALTAFSTVQAVAANNVANSQTPGFQPSSVTLEDTATGGVQAAAINQSAASGGQAPGAGPVYNAQGQLPAGQSAAPSGTDLAREFTGMIANQAVFSANTAAITTAGRMTGALLDMSV
ncbi:MAG: flagellar basal body rod protein [Desulfovibrionaceae bacterium]|nr:flagellar basal body rod protein [Desulfovibrionaceae bacterium]MBF0513587.1 flagellar basal body rod protein [Desulfovibrionaceae bacterium]